MLIEPELDLWGPAYLATDKEAALRDPPAVKIPYGPVADIADAWSGDLPWRPQNIRMPTLVVRGEWDSVTTDADAAWLLSRLEILRAATRRSPKAPISCIWNTAATALFRPWANS